MLAADGRVGSSLRLHFTLFARILTRGVTRHTPRGLYRRRLKERGGKVNGEAAWKTSRLDPKSGWPGSERSLMSRWSFTTAMTPSPSTRRSSASSSSRTWRNPSRTSGGWSSAVSRRWTYRSRVKVAPNISREYAVMPVNTKRTTVPLPPISMRS